MRCLLYLGMNATNSDKQQHALICYKVFFCALRNKGRIWKCHFGGRSLLRQEQIEVCGLVPRSAAEFLRLYLKCQLYNAKVSKRILTGNMSY